VKFCDWASAATESVSIRRNAVIFFIPFNYCLTKIRFLFIFGYCYNPIILMADEKKTLVFATANRNKLIEAAGVLGEGFALELPADLGYTNDVPETHFTIRENAIEKAQFVWEMFGKACFADDTGLEVDVLDGAPGVYSARYAGEPKNPVRNVQKLLSELEGVPFAERTARFRCVIALIEPGENSGSDADIPSESSDTTDNLAEINADSPADGIAIPADSNLADVIELPDGGVLRVFEGTCEGHISLEPHGELGFGYDPVFVPEGMEKTMAMLTLDEKNAISHRGHALDKLVAYLRTEDAAEDSAPEKDGRD
jgi:XTP/dITP diphosphohydrolase